VLARGEITEEDLLFGSWETFLEALAAGDTYVNVHTTDYPDGEIRGQLEPRGAISGE
jgi:hypothetical protein